jgi:hypothetical protein
MLGQRLQLRNRLSEDNMKEKAVTKLLRKPYRGDWCICQATAKRGAEISENLYSNGRPV